MGARKSRKSAPTTVNTDATDTVVVSEPEIVVATPDRSSDPIPSRGLVATFQKADLAMALARCASVADRKSSLPILANVLIRATEPGVVTFTATDLNVSTSITVLPNSIEQTGALCVPAKALADAVKSMAGDRITLRPSSRISNTLVLECGAASTSMIGISDRDFPKLPVLGEHTARATVDALVFADMLESVAFSVCKDETRFHLNGVYLEADGERTRAISTDGHRLTKAERVFAGFRITRKQNAIVPAKGVKEISKAIGKPIRGRHLTCDVAVTDTHAWLRMARGECVETLSVKLIDAQFPPYEQVIPKEFKARVTVERKLLLGALKRAMVSCTATRGAILKLASGKLIVKTSNPDTGESEESLPADHNDGATAIGVNPDYLIELLEAIAADDYVTIGIGNELDPILVRSRDDAGMRALMDAYLLGVVMPMRL